MYKEVIIQNLEKQGFSLYFQSITYKYEDPDHVAKLFDLTKEVHMYSRISNPTVYAYEEIVFLLSDIILNFI